MKRCKAVLATDVLGEVFAPGARTYLPIETRTLPVALGVFVDALFGPDGAMRLLEQYLDSHEHTRRQCSTCQDTHRLMEVLRLLKRTL
jgi:hypothetical protein